MKRPPLFECTKDEERIAFLFSNAEWTILIYDEAFPEGDRILAELDDYPVLLEVWIGDSDHWGYALYEKGKFSAGCTLNQEYAESSSKPPATSEDAGKICKILGFEDRLADVKRAQRKWHLFSDIPCERFCQTIGALPAVLPAKDIEGWNAGRLESCEIAGWKIEPLLFEKRKLLGHEGNEPILHALATRSFSPRESRSQVDPEFVKQMQRNVQVMVWLLRPIGWLLAAPFLIQIWLHKLGIKKPAKLKAGQEILSVILTAELPWHWDGSWLVNKRHGCRIRAPKPNEDDKALLFAHGVFRFFVGEIEMSCFAVHPTSIRRVFDLRPKETVLKDESFLVGNFPARILVKQTTERDGANYHYFWFVELPRAIYQFSVFQKAELPQSKADQITEVVKSFEVFSEIQNPDSPAFE